MIFGFTKDGLLQLDQHTRAFTLVGAYMGTFALLEAGINSAIGEVLEVDGLRKAIITRNMSFSDKIKTLRSLVDIFIRDQEEAKYFDNLAKKAQSCSEDRNVVAHTPFRASAKSNGVEFFVISANGKLKIPDFDWSIDDFFRQIDLINGLERDLRSIEQKMSRQRLARALLQEPEAGRARTSFFGGLLASQGEASIDTDADKAADGDAADQRAGN